MRKTGGETLGSLVKNAPSGAHIAPCSSLAFYCIIVTYSTISILQNRHMLRNG